MIDTENAKVSEILEGFQKSLKRKNRKIETISDEIVFESALIAVLCHGSDRSPSWLAENLNARFYGEEKEVSDLQVLQTLRRLHIANPVERKKIFDWAANLSRLFSEAIMGNRESFDEYEKLRKQLPVEYDAIRCQERIAAMSIFELNSEINKSNEFRELFQLGNTLAKYFFYDLSDCIAAVYGFVANKPKKAIGEKLDIKAYYEALSKIENLESKLTQTDNMLQELQNEFDTLIEECKTKELTDFFSRLNSEKYGCILDELIVLRNGIDELRKNNYELPLEINGLLIMVKKLILFIKDSRIVPIKKINEVYEAKASDVEFCIYEGSPFETESEIKKVKVISPGWLYKDKEIQISRPKVKEEK